MKYYHDSRRFCHRLPLCLSLACGLVAAVPAAVRANVYGAHLTPQGTSWDFTVSGPMNLSYRLNQVATSVTIEIFRASAPATVIRTLTGGTAYGVNTVSWDGKDNSSVDVPGAGDYKFRVIATDSVGAATWTNITPLSGGNEIGDAQYRTPNGIAVNRDQTSPSFGRIYVSNGNSTVSSNVGATAAADGLYLLNNDLTFRDGSAATAAASANASLVIGTPSSTPADTTGVSPWKININQNNPDEIVMSDFLNGYENVWIFNADGTTVSRILDSTSSGPTTGSAFNHDNAITAALTGTGVDRKLWEVDELKDVGTPWVVAGAPGDLIRFDIGTTPSNFLLQGTEARNSGLGNFFTGRSIQFGRVSGTSKIYACCRRANNTAGNIAIVKYAIDAGYAITGADWTVENPAMSTSSGRTWVLSSALAVDEDRTRGAVGSDGTTTPNASGGYIAIFNTSTGAYITSFQAHTGASVTVRGLDFDAAGNLCTSSSVDQHVRMWSPPDGPNSYTTSYYGLMQLNCGSPAPTISTQPSGAAVCPGDSVTLTVVADGHGTDLSYQWKRGSVNVGPNNASLVLNPIALSDGGTYTCTVTGCGTVVTTPVTVTVGATITGNPTDQPHKCQGGSASFSVTAVGPTANPTLSYQWYKGAGALSNGTDANGVVISGALSATLNLSNLSTLDNNTFYSVKVTDLCSPPNTVTSATGKLTFDLPVITVQPASTGVIVGQTANFSVTATDPLAGTLSYQWIVNGVDVPGATASAFARVAASADNTATLPTMSANIAVRVTSSCGSLTSNTVKLNMIPVPCTRNWPDEEGGAGATPTARKGDGDIDMDDYGMFQACYTGEVPAGFNFGLCRCYDRGGTANSVDSTDFAAFKACADAANGNTNKGAMVIGPAFCGETVLFSDNFDGDSSANWTVASNVPAQADVVLNYDYSVESIPSAPNSVGGTRKGLKARVNISQAAAPVIAALAYSNTSFSSSYIVRFDAYMTYAVGAAGTSTESLFGINGNGATPVAPTLGTATASGISPITAGNLFSAEADNNQSGGRTYRYYEGATDVLPANTEWVGGPGGNTAAINSVLPFSSIFPSPKALAAGVFGSGAGTGWGWVRVEIYNNVTAGRVTMKFNDAVVFDRPTAAYTSGKLMLGVMDLNPGSVMPATMYTVYDNIVVSSVP